MLLGDNIRAAREELGLTKSAAAEQVGVSATYWDKIEKNLSVPTVDVASRIKKVLKMSADAFFETSTEEARTPEELDVDLKNNAKQLYSIIHLDYNDDALLDLKKLKYGQKKAVLKFLKTTVAKAKEGDHENETQLGRKTSIPKRPRS